MHGWIYPPSRLEGGDLSPPPSQGGEGGTIPSWNKPRKRRASSLSPRMVIIRAGKRGKSYKVFSPCVVESPALPDPPPLPRPSPRGTPGKDGAAPGPDQWSSPPSPPFQQSGWHQSSTEAPKDLLQPTSSIPRSLCVSAKNGSVRLGVPPPPPPSLYFLSSPPSRLLILTLLSASMPPFGVLAAFPIIGHLFPSQPLPPDLFLMPYMRLDFCDYFLSEQFIILPFPIGISLFLRGFDVFGL